MVAQLQRITHAVEELLSFRWGHLARRRGLQLPGRPVSRQAFSWRLKTVPWQIFWGLLSTLFSAYAELVNPGQGLYHRIFTIQAIDGSVVDVAARLLKAWAGLPGRGGRELPTAQAKVHAVFDVSLGAPSLLEITGARRSEIRYARKLLRQGEKRGPMILVMDLGYFFFEFFDWLVKADVFFVSRLRGRTRYQRLKRLGRRDWMVRVGITAKTQKAVVLRLVGVPEGDEIFWYLTKLLPEHDISPQDVRAIYRKRWAVELFFKSWKHALRGSRFFCYNTNGIKIQIYASMCAYVMTRILIAQAARKFGFDPGLIGFDRAASIVRCWMFEYWERLWCLRPRVRYLNLLLERIALYAPAARVSKRHIKRRKVPA
jgi:Transposase DDE domain